MWGIDLVGKLPRAKGVAEFAIIAVDYFSNATSRSRPTDLCARWICEEKNDSRLREYLNFSDELRDEALYKILKYKRLLACKYNRQVKNCQFAVGDLVLRLFSASHPKEQSKLSPKWEWFYSVKRVLGPRTCELEDLHGKPVPRTWHPYKLCKYYV
ncbi:hypothetical protein LIER_22224 [Lithospermum erythrorhizon]|uniref:Uncharacterized protein n=1 Tax=Lithospermum erythrorhizon TaxID=34254 RepID=A0AAV3QT94_LITER